MEEELKSQDPFDPEFLKQTVLEELCALGWIENPTNSLVDVVTRKIELFLGKVSTIRSPQLEWRERIIASRDAAASVLYSDSEIKAAKLPEFGIEKQSSQTLKKSLYPLVYIHMLERMGFEVLDDIRLAFNTLFSRSTKKVNKTQFINSFRSVVSEKPIYGKDPINLIKGLEYILSSTIARKRLGEILFLDDEEALELWNKSFPLPKD